MTVPEPILPLENICSVIYNNTLYTYSSSAFQALPLEDGADWNELPSGISVEGGKCVSTTPTDGEAALYVVGGTSSEPNYQGLQKFSYEAGRWESIQLSTPDIQSRLWHGATYLNTTNSILVYAGNQDGSKYPSSQTFTINLSNNHTILAWDSIAPPTISPIMLTWSTSHAVMLGGADDNKRVMLFNALTGWEDSSASLASPLQDGIMAVLAGRDDGSKSLYTFDMSTSPNTVNRTVLVDGSGRPVVNSSPVQKREYSFNDWPAYNDTLAPTATRSSYSIAEDESGLVVIAGGNEDDVLCMFQAVDNQWLDAGSLFGTSNQVAIESMPSATADTDVFSTEISPSSTTSAEPDRNSNDSEGGLSPNALLGAVLGSIFGAATLLVLALFLLKKRKKRLAYTEAGHARRASGISRSEKDEMILANDFNGLSGSAMRGHQQQDSQGSFSSMAILMGKLGQGNKQAAMPVKRKGSFNNTVNHESQASPVNARVGSSVPADGTTPIVVTRDEKGVSFISDVEDPPLRQPGSSTLDPQGTRRSSGWNQYWSGGSAFNILSLNSKRTTAVSESSSQYSDPRRITQDSATVPSFHLDPSERVPPLGLQRVNSGSPTISQYSNKIPLKEGMVGQIERPSSRTSSDYSSGIPTSVQDSWDPIAAKKPWGSERAPSSTYSQTSMWPYPLGQQGQGPPPLPTGPGMSTQPQLAMASMSSDMSWLNLGEQNRGR